MTGLQSNPLFREHCYIGGHWISAAHQKTFPVHNPFDGALLGLVPDCGPQEIEQAISAAEQTFASWSAWTAKERSEILWCWSDLIEHYEEDLARILTLEQGKPIQESRNEIRYGNAFIRWYAEEARRLYGDIIPSNQKGQHLLVIKQPIGAVGAITPWNFPSAMITRKCAPALAVGCTVVVKPAPETPFSALALAILAEEAGFPAGTFNVITGEAGPIGQAFTMDPRIKKISFTGSTAIGKLLMKQSAEGLKKLSLELGGNAPFIVFDDANLDEAVKGALAAKFRNSGQTCVSANRILVQDRVYDAFTEKLIQAVKSLKMGNGMDETVTQGPLINQKGLNKVKEHVQNAVEKGAKIAYQADGSKEGPLFYGPTVLSEVTANMLIAREETFGPVAPLFRFYSEEEAIRMANDTEFGLASYFYTQDIQRVWRVSEQLAYGMVGINVGILSTEVAPFGGIKASGFGREGSHYGLDDYVEIKYVCMGA